MALGAPEFEVREVSKRDRAFTLVLCFPGRSFLLDPRVLIRALGNRAVVGSETFVT